MQSKMKEYWWKWTEGERDGDRARNECSPRWGTEERGKREGGVS